MADSNKLFYDLTNDAEHIDLVLQDLIVSLNEDNNKHSIKVKLNENQEPRLVPEMTVGECTAGYQYSLHDDYLGDWEGTAQTGAEIFNYYEGDSRNIAIGYYSHAEGIGNIAFGNANHVEGSSNVGDSPNTHVEGSNNYGLGECSHTEGSSNFNLGDVSHAEGVDNRIGIFNEDGTPVEGITIQFAHIEGVSNKITANGAHAEGYNNIASGEFSHVGGTNSSASGKSSFAFGDGANAMGYCSVVFSGYRETAQQSYAKADNSFSQGDHNTIEETALSASAFGEGHTIQQPGAHVEGHGNSALNPNGYGGSFSCSHVEGCGNTSRGQSVHVEGAGNHSWGKFNHVENSGNYIYPRSAFNLETKESLFSEYEDIIEDDSTHDTHVEGAGNKTVGTHACHIEGTGNEIWSSEELQVVGAHAEGCGNRVYHIGAHAEGGGNIVKGKDGHVEGMQCRSTGDQAHAEGYQTVASGKASHSEGGETIASGDFSHAEGVWTKTQYTNSDGTIVIGKYSHAEGYQTSSSGAGAHAEGGDTLALGMYSHAEGYDGTSSGNYSHTEGHMCASSGEGAHAEGYTTAASAAYSHAEGTNTIASNSASHAEGTGTTASGMSSHAEGMGTKAEGQASHAEGAGTVASGDLAHTEGGGTIASGNTSHAEGASTVASGTSSHAEGLGTIAASMGQHAGGKWNVEDGEDNFAFIIGNGESDEARSNAFTLDWSGNGWFAGDVIATSSDGYGISLCGISRTVAELQKFDHVGQFWRDADGNIMGEIFGDYENNVASGGRSTAIGSTCEATGEMSIAIGAASSAEAALSFSFGRHAHSYKENAYSFGSYAFAFAEDSMSIGINTAADSKRQVVLGFANVRDTEGKYLFIFGNGESSGINRSNALTLTHDGTLWVAADVTATNSDGETVSLVDTAQEVENARAGCFSDYTYSSLQQRLNAELGSCVRQNAFEQTVSALSIKDTELEAVVKENTDRSISAHEKIEEELRPDLEAVLTEVTEARKGFTNTTYPSLIIRLGNDFGSIWAAHRGEQRHVRLTETALGVTQKKNLLKNTGTTRTVSGVTFTVNSDGSITVNGTATATAFFEMALERSLPEYDLILSGCPAGGHAVDSYSLRLDNASGIMVTDTGEGATLSASEAPETATKVVIRIASGYTADNLVFYPMIRYKEINLLTTDSTYEPYTPSMQEQIDELKKKNNELESQIEELRAQIATLLN